MGWAGNAIAGKYAVGHISPMVLTFSRWSIALIIISIFAHRNIRDDWKIIQKNWFYLLLMGGFGYTAFNFLLYSALKFTSSVNVAIEQTAMPLLIFIMSFIIYRTRVTFWQIGGYWLTFIGVVLAVSHGQPFSLFEISTLNQGDLIMLCAGLFYAGYSVALRHKPEMHFSSFFAAAIAGGVVFSIGGLIYEAAVQQMQWPNTAQGIAVVIYTGIVPSLISQGCFILGVAALGANRAGLYINLVPVFTALMAVILLADSLYPYHLFAFLLTAGGVIIASKQDGTSTP